MFVEKTGNVLRYTVMYVNVGKGWTTSSCLLLCLCMWCFIYVTYFLSSSNSLLYSNNSFLYFS